VAPWVPLKVTTRITASLPQRTAKPSLAPRGAVGPRKEDDCRAQEAHAPRREVAGVACLQLHGTHGQR
jgi:hypothetical protein